jgi:UDP-3-O-[3-hydroxymyristoyl] glucosamine N-acyltransferase
MMLSVLKNATQDCVTYYTGNDIKHVSHLKHCKLYCNDSFHPVLEGVEVYNFSDPQLEFYKLSKLFKEDYMETSKLKFIEGSWIHQDAILGEGCKIYPGCIIGHVMIGDFSTIFPNCTIFSKTVIGNDTVIDANSVIGSSGMMWVWDGDKKVFLEQLGNVKIGDNCRIGSGVNIVRGSANETTFIGNDTCLAPGCMIGHGTWIGKGTHLANGVTTGGSSKISNSSFLGCNSTVSPGVRIESSDVIVGAGSLVSKDLLESGVYVGSPCKRIKSVEGKHKGVPNWKK